MSHRFAFALKTALAAAGLLAAALLAASVLPDIDADYAETLAQGFGPAAIVLLIALAIVVSPIPSGPVALAAGALYGTGAGGLLTLAGAVLGGSCAFALTRRFGRARMAGSSNNVARFLTGQRSQPALMGAVFVTRLVPFVSFDAVSYIAGLTPLTYWRYAVATAAGTAPVCFAFAAAGAGAASASPALLILASGITLALPAAWVAAQALGRARVLSRTTR